MPGDNEEQKQLLQQAARQAGAKRPHGHAWPMASARGSLVLAPNPGGQLSPRAPLLVSRLAAGQGWQRHPAPASPTPRTATSAVPRPPRPLPLSFPLQAPPPLPRPERPASEAAPFAPRLPEAFPSEEGEGRGSPAPAPRFPPPAELLQFEARVQRSPLTKMEAPGPALSTMPRLSSLTPRPRPPAGQPAAFG